MPEEVAETEPLEAPAAGEGSEAIETPPVVDDRTLDLSEFGDYKVPVKVDGEERFVPVSEVVNGHMMQADYTRKTQELAAEREQLAQARAIAEGLQSDPAGTLKVLAEWFGDEDGGEEVEDENELLDPLERQVKQIESRLEAQDREKQEQAQEAALAAELDLMHEQYGVPQDELLRFAVEQNIPNLQWAYATMQLAQTQAGQAAQSQVDEAEASRLDEKRGVAVVEGGADRASGESAATLGTAKTVRSVRDAFELAAKQLGRTG